MFGELSSWLGTELGPQVVIIISATVTVRQSVVEEKGATEDDLVGWHH